MADIHIHRTHRLGLARAREVAWQWAEEAEAKFDMECTVIEGESDDTVEFVRTGCRGSLKVSADAFELRARLGLLLGAFSKTIEGEIEKTLDGLLADGKASKAAKAAKATASHPPAATPAATAKAGAKAAARPTPKARPPR